LVLFATTKEASGSSIAKSSHSDTANSCYSLQKTGDCLREWILSEEEGVKHDEQITLDVIVLDHVVVDRILTRKT
jgi:hypothetical protein